MKRFYSIGLALAAALLFTTLVLFGYQQQAAAQTTPEPPATGTDEADDAELVALTPVRLDGQVILFVTVRVGNEITVTTPVTLDVASWIADLDGTTAITAAALAGEPATTITTSLAPTGTFTPTVTTVVTPALTSTLTSTVDVTVTGVITPILSLVDLLEDDADPEDADEDAEPVLRGEVLVPANLREGPGTDTPVIGSAQPGDIVVIVETNAAGDWYNLETGEWIAGFLVQLLEEDADPENDESGDAGANDAAATDEDADEDAEEDADEEGAEEATGSSLLPLPTSTPAAAPTPAPEAEDEAEDEETESAGQNGNGASVEYRVAVITGLLNLASGVEAMGGLMDEPQMLSANWNESMKSQAAVIRGSYQTISGLTPPTAQGAFHSDLLSALGDCDVAMDLLTNGLDSLNLEALEQAATLMVQCGGKMETVISDYPELLE